MKINVKLIGNGYEAYGVYNSTTNKIEILKGSMMKKVEQPSFSTTSHPTVSKRREMRRYLIDNGIVDDRYVFTKNYILGTPSFCYGVIAGRRGTAGRKTWKLENGEPLKAID